MRGATREKIIGEIVAYSNSDLLCYRAEQPGELAARQAEIWDPILDWAAAEYGIHLARVAGVMPRVQDEKTLSVFRQQIENEDEKVIAALAEMTALTGSAMLAFAVVRGRLSAEQAWAAAHVDEDWQIAQWGEDEEARLSRANRWRDMSSAARMVANRPIS